ncbi:hypothetical protein M951_chr3201 (nucleomorph) [Lotharella oceanica]|uniref:Uncharacterized protein n=1 Tax=Lotharella oceanica TaxID=641309 RepID=A0A060DBN7_9EUKA|nr:hypothetical protein M951_chr14 [Lotharella oceanica]AIB09706.1 hypothetical protein M951_chr1227 [Lotharella oceanica]AIB09707.1 hypothetical protein M951_chr24 [Lotharella oceanica]AIB09909.1 hypothetical protein M951_chr2217 [Lotharella oceanica]AIB09910.1 hypothetical protein M951_chr34 [Lotharella oceanica]
MGDREGFQRRSSPGRPLREGAERWSGLDPRDSCGVTDTRQVYEAGQGGVYKGGVLMVHFSRSKNHHKHFRPSSLRAGTVGPGAAACHPCYVADRLRHRSGY